MRKTIVIIAVGIFSISATAHVQMNEQVPEVVRESKIVAAFELNSFCKAIIQGDVDLVTKMISLGEDVNEKSLGKTPAHYAARYNKPEILEILIANGADLKKRCDQGYTVKKYAEIAESMEALTVIKKAMKK